MVKVKSSPTIEDTIRPCMLRLLTIKTTCLVKKCYLPTINTSAKVLIVVFLEVKDHDKYDGSWE